MGRLVLVRAALPRPDQRERLRRPRGRALLDGPASSTATAVASISTSAASSTPCCTCSTRASGTRCCSTSATCRRASRSAACSTRATSRPYAFKDERGIYVDAFAIDERDDGFFHDGQPVDTRARQDGQEPEERRRPRRHVRRVRRRHAAALRDVHGPARRVAPVGDPRRRRHVPLPATHLAQLRRRRLRRARASSTTPADDETRRLLHKTIDARAQPTWKSCGSTPPSPS